MKTPSIMMTFAAASLLSASCIKNDIPYPNIVPAVKSMTVDSAKSVKSDAKTTTTVITLDEKADISEVKITAVEFTEAMTRCSPSMVGTFDLRTPKEFTLTTYADYPWTVSAIQPIERYFKVKGQIGQSVFSNDTVLVKIPEKISLDNITVTAMKLGPADISKYSRTIDELKDFTTPQKVDVTVRDSTVTWTIIVEHSYAKVVFELDEPWVRIVYLKASGEEGSAKKGFRYRVYSEPGQPEQPWKEVENVKVDGGSFEACQDGLQPSTRYEVCAYCGEDEIVEEFITGKEEQIPNAGFEVYSKVREDDNFISFYDPNSPMESCRTKWWDSGNEASAAFGIIICSPDNEVFKEGKTSARLNSRNAIIKLAAGNVFAGEFAGLSGLADGKVNFGRPWIERPRHVIFSLKYSPGKVTYFPGRDLKKGDLDKGRVFVALGDWTAEQYGGTKDCPVQINTGDTTTFFKPDGPNVIAYAEYVATEENKDWIDVDLTLEYRQLHKKPTHIIISCAASMYGDYYVGSSDSILWVDDFKLVY